MIKHILRIGTTIIALALPVIAIASSPIPVYCGNLPGCDGSVAGLFGRIAMLAASRLDLYGYLLGGLFIIIGGARMLTSAGNEERFGAGKTTIIWALVGIFVANFASIMVNGIWAELTTGLSSGDLVIASIALIRNAIFDLMYLALFAVALFSGMNLVLARGQEDELKKSRNALIYAAVGAIVINMADRLIAAFVLL